MPSSNPAKRLAFCDWLGTDGASVRPRHASVSDMRAKGFGVLGFRVVGFGVPGFGFRA